MASLPCTSGQDELRDARAARSPRLSAQNSNRNPTIVPTGAMRLRRRPSAAAGWRRPPAAAFEPQVQAGSSISASGCAPCSCQQLREACRRLNYFVENKAPQAPVHRNARSEQVWRISAGENEFRVPAPASELNSPPATTLENNEKFPRSRASGERVALGGWRANGGSNSPSSARVRFQTGSHPQRPRQL